MGGPAGGSGAFGGIGRSAFLYGRGADYTGNDNNGKLTVSGTVEGSVGGWYLMSGNAENGSVTTENGIHIENGNIFGGYTHDGNASGNEAALTGTWVIGGPSGDYSTGAVFGGYTDRGDANKNTLTINEYSTIDFQAVGGQTYDGSADNNEVRIDTSFIGRDPRDLSEEEVAQAPDAVNGGSGDSASVKKVEMTDSMSWGRVTGGAAFTGEANVNRVTISGGHVVSVAGAASVMGGLSNGGDVRENHVTIQNGQKGAEVEYSVMGGYTLRGNAAGNTVTVRDETLRDEEGTRVHGGLYGGLTESGNVTGNSVTVTNVILDGKNLTDVGNGTDAIYGGRTEHGDASGNTVTVENSVVYDRVYGGWAAGGNAEKNAVELAGETGAADTIVGGFSEDGAANGNQVTTLAGAERGIATVYGGYGASAEENSILLNKDSDTELTVSHVYHMIGGYATDGDAAGNGVWIENSKVSVYGRPASGYDPTSYLAGGYAVGGTADGNWLVILNSTVERTPAAGEENTNLLIAGGVGETGANKNWVLMGDADGSGSRSTVTGNYIYGGYTERGSASDNKIAAAHADLTLTEASKGLIGGTAAADRRYGGGSGSGDAVNNAVSVTGGTVETKTEGSEYAAVLAGGYSQTGNVKGNRVDIYGGSFTDVGIYGGKTDEGDAVENKVHIDSGKEIELWSAVGGDTVSGTALGNAVTIEGDGTSLDANEIGGGWSTDGEASWNNVTLRGAVTAGLVYGGGSRSGDAADNAVYVSGAVVNEKEDTSITPKGLAGGFSETGDVSSNFVSITEGSSIKTDVYGGYTGSGRAEGNMAWMEDGTAEGVNFTGGWSTVGEASGNGVLIEGGTVNTWFINGGYSGGSDVSDNAVFIFGGDVTAQLGGSGGIYGGYAYGSGTASGNGVEISGADTAVHASEIIGGWSEGGSVLDNDVVISGGTTEAVRVYGGRSKEGDVSWNWVSMISGTVDAPLLYGGSTESGSVSNNGVAIYGGTTDTMRIVGGETKNGDADENHVLIMGDETKASSYIIGGSTETGSVSDNQVTVVGEKVTTLALYGGWVSKEGDASGNEVMLAGGESRIGAVAGGYTEKGTAADHEAWLAGSSWSDYVAGKETDIFGGYTSDGDALRNTVIVGRGTDLTGLSDTALFGGYTENGTARDNEVFLYGGRIKGDVAGAGVGDGGTAVGNTVTLTGEADVSEAALYGWKLTGEKGGTPADNDLIIDDWAGATQSAKHFDTIRFQGVAWDPGGTLLTITNGAEGDLENTKIDAGHVVILGGRTPQAGESMTFVKDETADTGLSEEQAAGGISQGVVTAGTADWDMPEAGKTLNYTITGVFRNSQTDAVAENRLAGAAFVNQGADIAADSLHLLDDGYHWGTRTFGAVYGNRSTYDAAGDFKINGWSTIVGAGNVHEVKGGRLAWGVFYENGTGNYRTWNEFNNEMFRGDGSLLYNGGGAPHERQRHVLRSVAARGHPLLLHDRRRERRIREQLRLRQRQHLLGRPHRSGETRGERPRRMGHLREILPHRDRRGQLRHGRRCVLLRQRHQRPAASGGKIHGGKRTRMEPLLRRGV